MPQSDCEPVSKSTLVLLTPEKLKRVMPRTSLEKLAFHADLINEVCFANDISTIHRMAAFLGQIALESGELKYHRELWGPTAIQRTYERDFAHSWPPTETANGNRKAFKLGNYRPGDGFRFRGWGWLQTTGRDNTNAASFALYGDARLTERPELLDDITVGAEASGFYWRKHELNGLADVGNIYAITKIINGGLTHYDKRLEYTKRAYLVLGEP